LTQLFYGYAHVRVCPFVRIACRNDKPIVLLVETFVQHSENSQFHVLRQRLPWPSSRDRGTGAGNGAITIATAVIVVRGGGVDPPRNFPVFQTPLPLMARLATRRTMFPSFLLSCSNVFVHTLLRTVSADMSLFSTV